MTRSCGGELTGKADQDLRDLDLLEHLPRNQSLSVYCLLYYAFQLSSDISRRRQWHPTPVLLPGEFPWREETGGLQLTGSQRVIHD